jgi:Reverse transcriptase (RNA-dependent DNA polymerase)
VVKRNDRTIKKLKTRKVWQEKMKIGIELPRTVQEVLEIDRRTGTTFWRDIINKEMATVAHVFEFVKDDEIPGNYQFVLCHMVFDVKMDLTRKARFVAGGHMTDPPKDTTYSSVVSRDSIRIAFLIAALNDLDILACDIQGAFLNAETKELIYMVTGLEHGAHREGQKAIIKGALYGLKSSGARWWDHLANTLCDFGYTSCKADPDVWMKPKSKPNGDKYWEYVLVYVDDILCISHESKKFMEMLQAKYKEGSVGEPTAYLGAEVCKHYIESSEDPTKVRWALSSDKYVDRAVKEVERQLSEADRKLTPELDARCANYYQGLIGILRWMCALGPIGRVETIQVFGGTA